MRMRGVSVILGAVLISSCTMSSKFSCNATAGDSCLSIEQVEAMTRFANDAPPQGKKHKMKAAQDTSLRLGTITKTPNGQSLWVAHKAGGQAWV